LPLPSAPSTPTPNTKCWANARGPVLDLQALSLLFEDLSLAGHACFRVQKRLNGARHLQNRSLLQGKIASPPSPYSIFDGETSNPNSMTQPWQSCAPVSRRPSRIRKPGPSREAGQPTQPTIGVYGHPYAQQCRHVCDLLELCVVPKRVFPR
jgi:hypothetical protein